MKRRIAHIVRQLLFAIIVTAIFTSCESHHSSKQEASRESIQSNQSQNPQAKKKKASKPKPLAKPKPADETGVYREALKAEIADVNGKLPVTVEKGVTVERFTVEGTDAVYYYMCDETVVHMDALRASADKMRKGTLEALRNTRDPETLHLLMMLKRGKMGLLYKYVGRKSGETVEIHYDTADLS